MSKSDAARSEATPAPLGSLKRPKPVPKEHVHECDLTNFGFALHFVEFIKAKTYRKSSLRLPGKIPNSFTSMERDLLTYQFQYQGERQATLISYCLSSSSDPTPVTVHLPNPIVFNSEGDWKSIARTNVELQAQALVSCTDFPASSIRVWHVVLTPVAASVYDIIDLIHLYDGRSESTRLREEKVEFQIGTDKTRIGVEQLLSRLPIPAGIRVPKEIAPRAGSVEIIVDDDGLIDLLQRARRGQKLSQEEVEILKPYAGIVTGIFDFDAIGEEEIRDTLEPTFPESATFLKINRCSLICIAKSDRAMDACKDTIGISPYLVIPHSVLLHNEFLIANANRNLDGGDTKSGNVKEFLKAIKREAKFFWDPRRIFFRLTLGELRRKVALVRKAVGRLETAEKYMKSNYLPNVFNYITERTLFEKGTALRGATDMQTLVARKLEDYRSQIEEVQRDLHEWRQSLIASILAVTLVGQINQTFFGSPLGHPWHTFLVILAMAVFGWFVMLMRAPEAEADVDYEDDGEHHSS